MGSAKQKTTIDTHTKNKKQPKHNTKDSQTIREENKRREERRPTKTNPKQFKKMAIGVYISITTLNVSGLNVPTKKNRLQKKAHI